ncbi:Uncharacterised protein [Mycolicibacterium aurum]|uniref:EspG family protein n=1 Tax=Mycolicibacterium aurum TaxID=1791 RepID=A0A3S4RTP1_MYCAU|nr:hypothetical protein [Mycolicibacterium aurum]VEG58187.1 Uncharacterised protein [Mycolicibacterium aurum]
MTYGHGLGESFEPVARVAVVDLESVCELYGLDVLPFPLGRSRPVGSVWLATRDVAPIESRLDDGDLRDVRGWVEALVRPDVCIECHVHHLDGSTPDLRLHGLRAAEAGFAAVQERDRDGVDVVEIYTVPPALLGAVVAESVGLVGAGGHPRIAVTGGGDHLPEPRGGADAYDDLGLSITQLEPRQPAVPVDVRDIVATGTVQSRHEPALYWGTDSARPILRWVQVRADGDYLYEADDSGYLEPLDVPMLNACIEGLVADVSRW